MNYLDDTRHLRHHAFVIEQEQEEGIATAVAWVETELGMQAQGNPDVVVLKYGLLAVEDARRVTELAAGGAFVGEHKVVIIAASRAYHEAQNALLKIFEEPPAGAVLFLIMPSLGGLLPTLRSRVQILGTMKDLGGLSSDERPPRSFIPEIAKEFLAMTKEKRSAFIKKLATGKDDEERREHREEAISIVNGIEAKLYTGNWEGLTFPKDTVPLLSDIAILREYLYDRSAPVRMILEHLSLVLPKDLV